MSKEDYKLVVFRSVAAFQDPKNVMIVAEADMVVIVPKYRGRWSEAKAPLEEALEKLGYNVEFREIGGTS